MEPVAAGEVARAIAPEKAKLLLAVRISLANSVRAEQVNWLLGTVDMALPDEQKAAAEEIVRILQFPTVAENTSDLLTLLEKRTASKAFNGDLWAAVAWAEEEQGIDVRSPPERPKAPEE